MEERLISEYDFMIIYLNCKYPYENLDKDLRKLFPVRNENYIAVHTEELIVDNNKVKGIGVCFLKFENRGRVKIFSGYDLDDFKNNFLVEELVEYLKENRENLNILYFTYSEKIGEFLQELDEKLSEEGLYVDAFGCIPYNERNRGLLFHNGGVIEDGFLVLTIESTDFKGGVSHGFKKTGPLYRITEAEGSKVYEIDGGRPITNLVEGLLKGLERRVEHLWYTPFLLVDNDGEELSPAAVKDLSDDHVELFRPVRKGTEFFLSFGDENMILESSKEKVKEISKGFKNVDLILTFISYPRLKILEERVSEELLFYMLSFDAPLMGLSTACELISQKSGMRIYNESSVFVALKERVL